MLTRPKESRLGRIEEPDTPYRAAQQLWDRRMGSAVALAGAWRFAAFALLGLCALSAAAIIMLLLRPAAVPFVIEAQSNGEARLIGPAAQNYQPDDAQISYHLARFIEMTRGIAADPVVVRQNWLRAYDWTTQAGAQALNAMGKEKDPMREVGKITIAPEVLSVVRASPNSFQVRWRESSYSGGALIAADRYTGMITIMIEPSGKPEVLQKNPLGLYVHAFSWSRDLHQ
jgi:type IV secretion system protein VirB5